MAKLFAIAVGQALLLATLTSAQSSTTTVNSQQWSDNNQQWTEEQQQTPSDQQWSNQLQKEAVSVREDPVTAEYEIVVARYRENATTMAWLLEVPDFYQITIYNTGANDHVFPDMPSLNYNRIDLPNLGGREGDTFATHLVRRYDSLAPYTIFSQADPFPHNEYFLELLKHPAMLGKVQTMSRLYLSEGEFETPKAAVDAMSKHPYYRSERFSLRTLNSVWYHDEGSINVMWGYWKAHNLDPGTNLIRHHFKLLGLPDWIPEEQEVGAFSFGALLGFEKSTVLQHPKSVYEKLQECTRGDWSNNFIVERIWNMLFAGPGFKDI